MRGTRAYPARDLQLPMGLMVQLASNTQRGKGAPQGAALAVVEVPPITAVAAGAVVEVPPITAGVAGAAGVTLSTTAAVAGAAVATITAGVAGAVVAVCKDQGRRSGLVRDTEDVKANCAVNSRIVAPRHAH